MSILKLLRWEKAIEGFFSTPKDWETLSVSIFRDLFDKLY
jgi:hypothetical protein